MKFYCLAAAAAAGLLGLGGCGKDATPVAASPAAKQSNDRVSIDPGSPQMGRIHVEPVAIAEVPVEEVTSPGKVEANSNRLSTVMLPVAGRIISVAARIGRFVKQGETLLTIESPDVDAAISSYLQAQASAAQARSVVAKGEADVDRIRDLFEHNAVARKEVLNGEAILVQSRAGLEQAQASIEQSRRRLEILGVKPGEFGQRLAVRAPISGKVMEMSVAPGEYRNDTSVPVLKIADLSTVWVTADIPETAIRLIKVGESLDIQLSAYPGETFRGRVTQIADTVDPATRTVKVRAELTNPSGRFRPEMFGRIRHVDATEQKPVVPAASVVQDDGRQFVWRENAPGSFQRVAVQLGSKAGDRVAVKDGLSAGDRIVTDGVMLLRSN